MDETEEVQNMVSNLPLLFANGYPTSLDKISAPQLEKFIPFMVQCSLGHINLQEKGDNSEPEWWPEDIPFKIPLTKPKIFEGNWVDKMKEIVVICYQFHKSIFLLRFCNELSSYEPARLRFINNYNSTTSLYDRRCNKLLVTFRNENMAYDQTKQNKKCLLLHKSRSQSEDNNNQEQMVQPALFDIYLCDNCDAELYSLDAITEHEKKCLPDDDVIICESTTLDICSPSLTTSERNPPNDQLRQQFLLNFNLQSVKTLQESKKNSSTSKEKFTPTKSSSVKIIPTKECPPPPRVIQRQQQLLQTSPKTRGQKQSGTTSLDKLKRLPRRNRGIYVLSRCPTIPLSSPAGQLMIRNSKTLMTEDYLLERLDRMERFCHAPVLTNGSMRLKFMDRKYAIPNVQCTFKKPSGYTLRTYMYPRRQFSTKYRMESFMFLNSLLLNRCRPLSIRLKKLTEIDFLKQKTNPFYFYNNNNNINNNNFNNNNNNIGSSNSNNSNNPIFNIRLKRESSHSANWTITPTAKEENVVDTIDLCSSDEEEDNNTEKSLSSKSSTSSVILSTITKTSASSSSTSSSSLKYLATETVASAAITTTTTSTTTVDNPIPNPLKEFFSSELTITPLKRKTTDSLSSTIDEIQKKSKYEGNFLLSQSIGNQPKPLQPSVFLFSNYTTETVHFHHYHQGSPNGINGGVSIAGGGAIGGNVGVGVGLGTGIINGNILSPPINRLNNTKFQNQENVLDAAAKTVKKSTTNSEDWLTSNKQDKTNGRVIQIMTLMDSEATSTISKKTSPNRSISIDLTS